jgi:hypothetical protein
MPSSVCAERTLSQRLLLPHHLGLVSRGQKYSPGRQKITRVEIVSGTLRRCIEAKSQRNRDATVFSSQEPERSKQTSSSHERSHVTIQDFSVT